MASQHAAQRQSGGSPFRAIRPWIDRSISYRMAFGAAAALSGLVFAVSHPHDQPAKS